MRMWVPKQTKTEMLHNTNSYIAPFVRPVFADIHTWSDVFLLLPSESPCLLVSNLDYKFPEGLPAACCQVCLRLPCTFRRERVLLIYIDLYHAVSDQFEEFGSVVERLVGRYKVVGRTAPSTCSEMLLDRYEMETYEGRRSLRFFSTNFKGGKGGTGPDAFPTQTIVPFLRMNLKSSSNLSEDHQY